MKSSFSLDSVEKLLQVIILGSTIVIAVGGFLFKQAQWGVLIALLVLLAGLLLMHLMRVQDKDSVAIPPAKKFMFDGKPRTFAAVSLAALLLVGNIIQFFPATSQWVQSIFWFPSGQAQPVERYTFTTYSFEGAGAKNLSGDGYLWVTNRYENNQTVDSFQFDYNLPKPDSSSYAGFGVRFTPQIDLSSYKYLAFRLKLNDSAARVRVSIKDASKNDDALLVGDGKYAISTSDQGQEILIPLKDYPNTVKTLVKEIIFSLDGTIAKGSSSVTIENIRFTR